MKTWELHEKLGQWIQSIYYNRLQSDFKNHYWDLNFLFCERKVLIRVKTLTKLRRFKEFMEHMKILKVLLKNLNSVLSSW